MTCRGPENRSRLPEGATADVPLQMRRRGSANESTAGGGVRAASPSVDDQVVEPEDPEPVTASTRLSSRTTPSRSPDRCSRPRRARRVDQDPGAQHVEGDQYADDRHPTPRISATAADRLKQQVRRPGHSASGTPACSKRAADAGDAAAAVVRIRASHRAIISTARPTRPSRRVRSRAVRGCRSVDEGGDGAGRGHVCGFRTRDDFVELWTTAWRAEPRSRSRSRAWNERSRSRGVRVSRRVLVVVESPLALRCSRMRSDLWTPRTPGGERAGGAGCAPAAPAGALGTGCLVGFQSSATAADQRFSSRGIVLVDQARHNSVDVGPAVDRLGDGRLRTSAGAAAVLDEADVRLVVHQ